MIALICTLAFVSHGQVRPDQFPDIGIIGPDNFEVYSQKGGVNTKASPEMIRAYTAPDLVLSQSSNPGTTGNASALYGDIVEGPTGNVYYIDYFGRALQLNVEATIAGEYKNDVAAVNGGVSSGNGYRLGANNTYGMPAGSYRILSSITNFATGIVGGSGVCHVSTDPSTISDLNSPDERYDCHMAIDHTDGTIYKYDGSAWTELAGSDSGVATVGNTATITHTLPSNGNLTSVINNASVTPTHLDRSYLETEVDGDNRNEIQSVDSLFVENGVLNISLSEDSTAAMQLPINALATAVQRYWSYSGSTSAYITASDTGIIVSENAITGVLTVNIPTGVELAALNVTLPAASTDASDDYYIYLDYSGGRSYNGAIGNLRVPTALISSADAGSMSRNSPILMSEDGGSNVNYGVSNYGQGDGSDLELAFKDLQVAPNMLIQLQFPA
jgi:hypothetical protein